MTDYAAKAELARRLLDKMGQPGFVRRVERSGGGPSDPTGGTETTTDYPCVLAILPIKQEAVDGTTIRTGDWHVIVSAFDAEMTTNDQIVCSEGVLQVIEPNKIAPAGTVVIYDAVARG